MSDTKDKVAVQTSVSPNDNVSSSESAKQHTSVTVDANTPDADPGSEVPADQLDQQKKGRFAYFRTKEFYIILVLG